MKTAKLFIRRLFVTMSMLALGVFSARAQTPEQPIAVPVKIRATATAMRSLYGDPSTVNVEVEAYGGPVAVSASKLNTGTNPVGFGSNLVSATLEPGKNYQFRVSTELTSGVGFQVSPPPGFAVEIDAVKRTAYYESQLPADGYYDHTYSVRVLAPGMTFSGRAGAAASIQSGRVYWQVALGYLRNGESAGALTVVDAARGSWGSLFTPAGLSSAGVTTQTSLESEVYVYREQQNGSPWVRQVSATEAFVDVVYTASATSYELRFYHPSQVQGSSYPKSFTGLPFVSYKLERDGSDTKLKITSETRTLVSATDTSTGVARTATTTLERTGAYPNFTWTLVDWTTAGQSAVAKEVRSWSSDGNGGHSETRQIISLYGGAVATQVSSVHSQKAWATTPTSVTIGTSNTSTTTYDYYETASEASYAMVKSRKVTGDTWESYQYFSDTPRAGMVAKQFRPYADAPAAVNLTDENSGAVTTYDYAADAFGMYRRPKVIETKINGVVVSRADIEYTSSSANSRNVVVATRNDQVNSSGSALQTITKYYREDTQDQFFRSQLFAVQNPDGTKQSYAYERGDWSGSAFTANTGGAASRVAEIHGVANAVSGSTSYSQFGTCTVDTVHLVLGKSTADVTIRDAYARIARTEQYVWNGSSWELLASVDYEYNLSNFVTKRTSSNGGVYEAYYAGELKEWERDETGAKISYTYDAAGRIYRATREGANGLPDVVTEYAYNPAGQIVRQDTYASGGYERLGSSFTYDQAGRLLSETSPGRGATTYAYAPATRQRTTTYPDGGTVVEERYVDGMVKSITGAAVVAQYYAYGRETDGRRYAQVNLGTSNSVRWSKTWTDWVGRVVRSEQPGAPGQSTSYTAQTYNGAFLQSTERTGYAKTLYEYDEFGQVTRSGLDLGSNGQLDSNSTDRIAGAQRWLVKENGAWWAATRSYTYPANNDGTEKTLQNTRVRLTGFTGNLRSEEKITDAEDQTITTTVTVDRTAKKVVTTTSRPELSSATEVTMINGLQTGVKQPDGLTYSAGYDSLRRPTTATDPRTGTTTTAYYAGTAQVSSVTDAAGYVTAQYGYDKMARPAWTRNAGGHNTLFEYNQRGQLLRQWGDAAYPVSYDYDAYGERTAQCTYQQENNWHSTTWPGGTATSTTSWTFDGATGLLTRKTDASGRYVDYDYNERGQVWHRYWMRKLSDNVTPVTTTYTYHSHTGELASTTYNDGTPAVSIIYTRMGQPDTVGDFTGTRDFVYDGTRPWRLSAEGLDTSFYAGRMLTMVYNESTTASGSAFGPHTTGLLKGRLSGYQLGTPASPAADLEVSRFYSNAGRFAGVTSKWRTQLANAGLSSRDFTYYYEANSALIDRMQAGNFKQGYDYEAKRNLRTVVESKWQDTTPIACFDYKYNGLGQRTAAGQSGAAFADYGSSGIHHRYVYNGRGEVTEGVAYDGGDLESTASPISGRFYQFGYDAAGNRTSANHTGVSGLEDQVTVNALNQITTRENNLVSPTGTVTSGAKVIVNGQSAGQQGQSWSAEVLPDNLNAPAETEVKVVAAVSGSPSYVKTETRKAVTMRGGESLAYDLDGNLSSDDRWDYAWDAENRLIAMETKAWAVFDPVSPRVRLEFRYDYLGRRVLKKKYSWSGSAWSLASEQRFVYDGWNLIAETNGSSVLQRTYTWGLDVNQSLAASGGVGALLQIADHTAAGDAVTYAPSYDGNGNIVALTRMTDGAITAKYEYSPFGELIRCEGDYAKINPFRFSTKFTDQETGLVYYGHRYYSPSLGRFINRDPIEETGGLNLYAFVANNPLNAWDYLGMTDKSKPKMRRPGQDQVKVRFEPGVPDDAGGLGGPMSLMGDDPIARMQGLAAGFAAETSQFAADIANGRYRNINRTSNRGTRKGTAQVLIGDYVPFDEAANGTFPSNQYGPYKDGYRFGPPVLAPNSAVPTPGYTDPFGNRHVSFCMSCHAPTPEAQFNKQQHVLANALDYKVILYEQILGTVLTAGGSVIAQGMTKADTARQILAVNRAGAAAWEGELLSTVLPRTQTNIQAQITIRSNGPSGLAARLDAVGTDATGTIRLTDGKLSPTAPLTPNQSVVYPELRIYGGTVTGKGKPPYTGGTQIPPTTVDILIPPGGG